MTRIKLIIIAAFVSLTVIALASEGFAYPPFLAKARKFGAKDCTFCHVHAEGGEPWNERGQWLLKEKERRKAENVEVEWLTEYKPGKSDAPKAPEAAKPTQAVGTADAAPEPKDPVSRELLSLERKWIELGRSKDRSALDSLLGNEFISTDEGGHVMNKGEFIASFARFMLDSYKVDDFQTRVYGDTAVVTARWWVKGSSEGTPFAGEMRETDVWVKRNGQWQVVAMHSSRMEKK